jgi:DNA-binding CsgD family transcriptional regulator
MNDCRHLSASALHLSVLELEQILKLELAKLGVEQFVLMIVDANQRPIYQNVCGFSHKQMQVYEENMAHDAFFHHYAHNGYLGQLLYMQEMLPMRNIRDPIFNEVLVPTMRLYHSYSGLAPLMSDHYVMLSSHCDHALNYRSRKNIDLVWRFLSAWGNYWIAQKEMTAQLRQFETSMDKSLLVESLTQAELDVLNMLAQGLDGSEVAARRKVSKETVRSQIKQILHKTGCRHQNQLLTRYFHSGIQRSSKFISLSPEVTRLI